MEGLLLQVLEFPLVKDSLALEKCKCLVNWSNQGQDLINPFSFF